MTLEDRFQKLWESLPRGGEIYLDREAIGSMLGLNESAPSPGSDEEFDLTIAEAAACLRQKPSTVRNWCSAGYIRGYKRGRSWRVPRQALREFQERGRTTAAHTGRSDVSVDLGAWKKSA
jgi:excisionase family DNA binding protein